MSGSSKRKPGARKRNFTPIPPGSSTGQILDVILRRHGVRKPAADGSHHLANPPRPTRADTEGEPATEAPAADSLTTAGATTSRSRDC